MQIKPKLFIIPPHAQARMPCLRLLQSFQLFIIKENKDNIFHYLKFLKGKADRKQCKSIKDTLTHINDFFGTFTNQIKKHVLPQSSFNPNPAFEYLMLQQFINSQDFTNIQILIITRILMKIFLIKFIRASRGSHPGNEAGRALETLIQYYSTIRSELSTIEEIVKNDYEAWFIPKQFYDVDHETEKNFILELKSELNSLKTGFHQSLQDQQV